MASLLELMVSRKIISADQAREAAALAEETGAFIGRILVSQGAVEEQLLARFLATECTEPCVDEEPSPDAHLVRLLPERLMRNYRMVPLSRSPSGILRLAVAEPLSVGGIDQVKRRLGMPVRLVLVASDTMEALLGQIGPPAERVQTAPQTATQPHAAPSPIVAEEAESSRRATAPGSHGEAAKGLRDVGVRTEVPAHWKPAPVHHALPPALDAAYEALLGEVRGRKKTFVVVVGSDAARDLVLRRFCTSPGADCALYVDLVAHCCPDDLAFNASSPVVFDGVDAANADEEEERSLLRAISTAYASQTPMIIGMRNSPKDSAHLSRGMRLTLGLAQVVAIEASAEFPSGGSRGDSNQMFHALVGETAAWSEAAFAGASLRPLMEAVGRAFERGDKVEAIAKATTSVASRLSHLSGERGR